MKRPIMIVFACVLGAASPAFADNKADVRAHMEAAAVAYKEGRFEDTLVELNKAYALDPKPELHYSIGQVYVKLNRCPDAILAYESFLSSKPSRERADLANQAIATCKAQPAPEPVTTPPTDVKTDGALTDPEPPPGIEAPTTTVPTTAPIVDSRPAWYKDKLGLALTGSGAVLTVVGLVMLSSASGKIDDAENADNYGESQSLYDDAKSQRTTGIVVTLVGVAAIGVGGWRLWQKRSEEQQGVAFVPTTNGGMITYAGGF